jgi:hypothetical protein
VAFLDGFLKELINMILEMDPPAGKKYLGIYFLKETTTQLPIGTLSDAFQPILEVKEF